MEDTKLATTGQRHINKVCVTHGVTPHYGDDREAFGGKVGVCVKCDLERRNENRRIDTAASERLGYGRRTGGGTPWGNLSRMERAKERDFQRKLDGPIVTPSKRSQVRAKFEHEMLGFLAFEDAVERLEYQKLDEKHDAKTNGYVYILSHPAQPAFKVGHSRNPDSVVTAANRFCPNRAWRIEHAVYTLNRQAKERAFHQDFDHRCVGGEFFLMPLETIIEYLEIENET